MLLRIVVEAEAEDPQGAKESLAMALERYAPARVVEVAPVYRQERMAGAAGRAARAEVSPEAADSTSSPKGTRTLTASVAAPTDGVVGPFARADSALMAAMEANEEIRG